MTNDIGWAQDSFSFRNNTASTTLAVQSAFNRITPYLKKNEFDLDTEDTMKMIGATDSLAKLLIDNPNPKDVDVRRQINMWNRCFKKDAVQIDEEIYTEKIAGDDYKYAIFNFGKEKTPIRVYFLKDYDKLSSDKKTVLRQVLRIRTDEDVAHLSCPGLENVWLFNPTTHLSAVSPATNAAAAQDNSETSLGFAEITQAIEKIKKLWPCGYFTAKKEMEEMAHVTKGLGLDDRPVTNGLLHCVYVGFNTAAKEVMNPLHKDKVAVYGYSGYGWSSFILATDANNAFFIDKTPLDADKLNTLLNERWDDLAGPDFKRGFDMTAPDIFKKKFRWQYADGFSGGDNEGMFEIERGLLFELKNMGVQKEKENGDRNINIAKNPNGTVTITFDWAYKGQRQKRYSITYIEADMEKPETYEKLLPANIDIYMQKGSREGPSKYHSYLPMIASRVAEGGYIATDDLNYDNNRNTTEINPDTLLFEGRDAVYTQKGEINSDKMRLWSSLLEDKQFNRRQEPYNRYGWYFNIRQRETSSQPAASTRSTEKPENPCRSLPDYTGAGNTSIHVAIDKARQMITQDKFDEARQLLDELRADLITTQKSMDIEDAVLKLADKWNARINMPYGDKLFSDDVPKAIADVKNLLQNVSESPPMVIAPEDREKLIRIAVTLASFGHGTNAATEVTDFIQKYMTVADGFLYKLQDRNLITPPQKEQLLQKMFIACKDLSDLSYKAKEAIKNKRFRKEDLLTWQISANKDYRLFDEGLRELNAFIEGIRPNLTDDEEKVLDKLNTRATELKAMLLDRLSLMDGKISDETFDLAEVFNEILDDQLLITSNGVFRKHFLLNIPSGPIFIKGNRRSIISMVCNIADDCFHYARRYRKDDTKVVIDVTTAGNEVMINISDNGKGMSIEELQNINEPFYTTGGTGIGLTEARLIVKDHGGTINITSEIGKGTTFTIGLPIAPLVASSQTASVVVNEASTFTDIKPVIDSIRTINSRIGGMFADLNDAICSKIRQSYSSQYSIKTYIATTDGKISGYAVYDYSGGASNINFMAVDPSLQDKGIGTELMKAIFFTAAINGRGKVTGRVISSNIDVLEFFRKIARRMGYKYEEKPLEDYAIDFMIFFTRWGAVEHKIRRTISRFYHDERGSLGPDRDASPVPALAQTEADRIHIENRDKYTPALSRVTPEKTILCHIVTDSILPLKQRQILQDLEKEMADGKYIEKVVQLKIKDSSEFIDRLQALMKKKREEYKKQGYNVQFDVACPDTELVGEALKLGIKALAFEPCKETEIAVMQVESIILALRALDLDAKAGKIEALRGAFKFLTGKELPQELSAITDINEFIKKIIFTLPVNRVDYNSIKRLNEIIRKNIESAA